MQGNLTVCHFRDDFFRRDRIHKYRLRGHDLRNHLLVSFGDLLLPAQELQGLNQLHIAAGRRFPVILNGLTAEIFSNFRKTLQSNIDDLRLLRQ